MRFRSITQLKIIEEPELGFEAMGSEDEDKIMQDTNDLKEQKEPSQSEKEKESDNVIRL